MVLLRYEFQKLHESDRAATIGEAILGGDVHGTSKTR